MIPLIVLVVTTVFAQQNNNYVSVSTNQGRVQGKTVNYGNDQSQLYYGQANVFLGIPYAQPPVGDLRFQVSNAWNPWQRSGVNNILEREVTIFTAPQPMNSFPSSVYDATYYRPKCPQPNGGNYVNEDCLYLNVFTQQTNNSSMAVMVFIDGGDGLSTGGCDQSQMKGTVRNLVSRGVVVVTFQYRLGALGFFSTTAAGFQSNNGMLDQVMVLQWVQQNIQNFGGDPNRVTLCGQGDGACAVDAHTLSPLSQNLFQQAIIQSGTINSCYSPDGTVPVVSNPPTTTMPSLQYDPGLQYTPLDQGGQSVYQGYYSQGSQYNNQQGGSSQGNYQGAQQVNSQQGSYSQGGYQQGSYNNQQGGSSQGNYQQGNNQAGNYQGGYNQQSGSYQNSYQGGYNQQGSYQGNNFQNNQGSYQNGYQSPQYDQGFVNPSQQLAQQLCNVSATQWNSGNVGNLKNCLNNYSVDFIVQTQGQKVATWLIVRDNSFLPGSPEQLASRRPPIPIIIGTVQDEDADYAFKLVANGNASQSEGDMLNNWMVDFARKNKVNNDPQAQAQIENIIANNYNITPTPSNNYPYYYQTTTPGRVYDYTGQNSQFQNNQQTGYNQQNSQYQNNQYNNQQTGYQQYNNQQYQTGYNQQNSQYQINQQAGQQYNQNGQSYPNSQQYNPSQPPSPSTVQSLRTMSTITSDSGITSETATAIDSFTQNGNTMVRVFQFTFVTNLGRQGQPNLGDWKPVTKGTDQLFLFMSETIWTSSSPTSADRQMADQMGQQWTQFAKNGQVNNWQPTNGQNYNYCSLNTQPSQQTGYGSQARNVFQQQVQPIVTQSQQQQGLIPQRDQSNQQCCQQQQSRPPAQAQYSQNGDSSSFQISFTLQNNLPNNG